MHANAQCLVTPILLRVLWLSDHMRTFRGSVLIRLPHEAGTGTGSKSMRSGKSNEAGGSTRESVMDASYGRGCHFYRRDWLDL
jgi:hypothetical protein